MHSLILSYLQKEFTEPIRDPLWNNIYLAPGYLSLISTEPFQQLGRIRQLGPAFHLYPGAVHTRLNHSLGVFQIAKKLITSLIIMSSDTPVKNLKLTLPGVKSFLSAALLHDLGHFPFAHSLKELPLKDHEILSGEIIMQDPSMKKALADNIGADPAFTAAIIDNEIDTEDTEIGFYRGLLSGPLDPDKLDYLNRDAYFCGVPYGIQDVDFIIDRLRITDSGSMAILENGTGAIEHLLFAKYLMYRNVYWHRTVRSATAMIKKSLILALENGILSPDRLYNLDDETFNQLCSSEDCSGSSLCLIQQVMHRELHSARLEIPFDQENAFHHNLESLASRSQAENEIREMLAQKLGTKINPWDVIIDIPEKISFKANIPVIQKNGHTAMFSDISPVFTAPVIKGFTESLRVIRVFLNPGIEIDETLGGYLEHLLNELYKS